MSVGDNIKELRRENNLTQEELASKIYVTRNAISKWETDKGIPSIDNLKQLSSLFKVSLDQLVNEEDRIVMALENSKRIQDYKDMFASVGVFLSYCLNGILIPYIFLSMNGFNEDLINIVLLPLIYIYIGITSILRDINWKYLVIASALAMIPVYILYDVILPEYGLGFYGLIHYLIFIGVYFSAKKIISILIERFDTKKIMVMFQLIATFITLIYVIHSIIRVVNVSIDPWYIIWGINLVYYTVPMMIPTTLYLHFKELTETV